MSNLVSIVIPVYGVEKYIGYCIESIIAQTYEDFEAIFVDDGSPDGSSAIVESYMGEDPRIKLVHHSCNKGLFRARVTGIEHAKGEYITFIDSDDSISTNWLETLANKLDDTGADIVIGDLALDNGRSKKVYSCDPIRLQDYDIRDENVLGILMRQKGYYMGWSFVWNKMYRRDIWVPLLPKLREFCRKYGHTIMCEDIAFCFSVFSVAKHMVNVHGAHYYYNLNDGSSTNAKQMALKFEKNVRDANHVFNYMKHGLIEQGVYVEYIDDYVIWRYRFGSKFMSRLKHVECTAEERERFKRYIIRYFGLKSDGNFMLDIFPYSAKEPLKE